MGTAALWATEVTARRTPPPRRLALVSDPSDDERGGIWTDEAYAAEAGQLAQALRGLALLEAEILSL